MKKYTTPQAALYLNCSESKLEKDRSKGSEIAFLKVGRKVFYTQEALDGYLARRTFFSTSEYGGRHDAQ